MKSNNTPYEMLPSLDQDLKFNVLKLKKKVFLLINLKR